MKTKLNEAKKNLQTILDSCARNRSRVAPGECGCKEWQEGGECIHTRLLAKAQGLYADNGHGSFIRVNDNALAERLAAIDAHRNSAGSQSLPEWVAGEIVELGHIPNREKIRAAINQVHAKRAERQEVK